MDDTQFDRFYQLVKDEEVNVIGPPFRIRSFLVWIKS